MWAEGKCRDAPDGLCGGCQRRVNDAKQKQKASSIDEIVVVWVGEATEIVGVPCIGAVGA